MITYIRSSHLVWARKKLLQHPLKLFFVVIFACASKTTSSQNFKSPEDFFAQDYTFFNKHFYKLDPFYYESKLENPLNLSPDFMLACLNHLYAKRTDTVCASITRSTHNLTRNRSLDTYPDISVENMPSLADKPVDALISACRSIAGLQAKFLALKKSIQEYHFNFKHIHIFVGNAEHAAQCKQLLSDLFAESYPHLSLNFIFTNRQSELYIRGLRLLKLSDQLSPAYIIIEESPQLADKYVTESKNILSGASICLGANIFPIKDPLLEAKIHGYDKLYPDYKDLICAWFHSALNFYARALHYNLTHKENVRHTEYYVAKRIRQKDTHHDLEKSYYFSKLSKLHLQKSPLAANQATSYFELLRALGTLIYAKEIYAPHNKPDNNNKYHLDQQITVLKENVLLEFSKNGLSLLSDQRDLTAAYQKELEILHKSVTDKLPALNSGSNNSVMNNTGNASISNNSLSNQALGDIYHEISIARESLLKQIITDALEVVGAPPCQFAIISYGSTARAEATPYSDIEFGIIVEKNSPDIQAYFEKLAAVIIYKLIALGKTPVSYLNIASLTQQSPFIDLIIPAGFSPEMLNAKLPLSEERTAAFFGTIPEVIYRSRGKKHCFSTSKLLYGNTDLFAEYMSEKHKNPEQLKKEAKKALESEMSPFSQVMVVILLPFSRQSKFELY